MDWDCQDKINKKFDAFSKPSYLFRNLDEVYTDECEEAIEDWTSYIEYFSNR